MIKFPENLEDWTRGFLIDLIDIGYDENLKIEFKSQINEQTKKIPTTTCAFANTGRGFLVFGIDNDRKKKLSTNKRLIGLEDSDDLKSKIENQIRTIKPSLPTECYEFKESNIKLPNGKVVVVLKIEKSNDGPHQFEDRFWKRVANGNAIMKVAEIKKSIIKSRQLERILFLLQHEEKYIMDIVEAMKIMLEHKDTTRALSYVKHLTFGTFKYFLYDYANYYSKNVQETVFFLIYELERLITNSKIAGSGGMDDETMELFKQNLENLIGYMSVVNQELVLKFEERSNGFKERALEIVKKDMKEAIKNAPEKSIKLKSNKKSE